MGKMTRVEKKRRRRKRTIFIFLVILLLLISRNIFKRMKYFNIKDIKISGISNIKEEEIYKVGNFKKGQNLFELNSFKIKSNLKNITYIKDVKVEKKLPDKLLIKVNERKEQFIIKDLDNKNIILDDEGIILGNMDDKPHELIYIDNISLDKNIDELDFKKSVSKSKFLSNEKVVGFIIGIGNFSYRDQVKRISLVEDDTRIFLNGSREVVFGKLRDVDYKLRFLQEILKELDIEEIEFSKILMDRGENPVIIRQNQIDIQEEGKEDSR